MPSAFHSGFHRPLASHRSLPFVSIWHQVSVNIVKWSKVLIFVYINPSIVFCDWKLVEVTRTCHECVHHNSFSLHLLFLGKFSSQSLSSYTTPRKHHIVWRHLLLQRSQIIRRKLFSPHAPRRKQPQSTLWHLVNIQHVVADLFIITHTFKCLIHIKIKQMHSDCFRGNARQHVGLTLLFRAHLRGVIATS